MLVNNMQELTTTIGTGNVTLSGSSENGRTFSSQLIVGQRFSYVIDNGAGEWESGVGYLSDSTTLVRETPLDGSAAVPVALSAGDKQVFIAMTAQSNPTSYTQKPSTLTDKIITSSHYSQEGGSMTVTANRLYYTPFVLEYGGLIDAMGYPAQGGETGIVCMALYSVDGDGDPAKLIIGTKFTDPISGTNWGSLSPIHLPAGKYWAAFYSNTTPQMRCPFWYRCRDTGMTGQNYELRPIGSLYKDGVSITELPDDAIQPDTVFASNPPMVLLRAKS
ncbi:hypothetical protein Q4575_05290 [Psychrosphaera sp. 1_MG-2023]|uniref:hypothetical protein n=1 Tax=Psychrosphaera sp. 1_MG-2023 TaxID=3062643 RepID=UPI0026E16139|nr:hypothetical protein [Psychrosphaera sp. 1_MG-2023]MDO6718804.1 hypothetical protein [Psychrosphaera sp. 1_MG-2023]